MLKCAQKYITNEFTFFRLTTFAAKLTNQSGTMEVITIESKAFKELQSKINVIVRFVDAIQSRMEGEPDDGWVDSYDVCTFLKVSERTLQRLRAAKKVNYSLIGGKVFYRISEIRRMMNENIIRRTEEHLQDLIKNNRLHVEQRRNIKNDK
jgi:hypothetical protein